MTAAMLEDALTFTGTLFVVAYHWAWLAVAAGLGAWVGWRTAAEGGAPGGKGTAK